MKLQDLRIGARLGLAFGLVLALAVLAGAVALLEARRLAGVTGQLYEHPFTVSNTMREIRIDVLEIQRDVRRLGRSGSATDRAALLQRIAAADEKVLHGLDLVQQRYLGPTDEVVEARALFQAWRPLRDALLREDPSSEAPAAEAASAAQLVRLEDRLEVILGFAERRAQAFYDEARQVSGRAFTVLVSLVLATILASVLVSVVVTRSLTRPLHQVLDGIQRLATGHLDVEVDASRGDELGDLGRAVDALLAALRGAVGQAERVGRGDYAAAIEPRSEADRLGLALAAMTAELRRGAEERRRAGWLEAGQAGLDEVLRGDPAPAALADRALAFLARYLDVPVAALYLPAADGRLVPLGRYGLPPADLRLEGFAPGEGLVGQAARERRPLVLQDVPADYLRVTSGLGETPVRALAVHPLLHDDVLCGVLELGRLSPFSEEQLHLLRQVGGPVSIAIQVAEARQRLEEALAVSREQSAQLQVQQEELRVANEELSEQTTQLRESRARLQDQQEELRSTNEELEEGTARLEEQARALEAKNRELEATRGDLERKAEELAAASRYKSQFLASMSHELRTPLNSLLLLARSLSDNRTGNLSAEQVESARIIHRSGQDLLHLINEILDLSKIEAGRMEPEFERTRLEELLSGLEREFRHQAVAKGLAFEVEVAPGAAPTLETDRQRLAQVLRNLLSNALKFTAQGQVRLRVEPAAGAAVPALAFHVEDTGIGVAVEHQQRIFDAFQQAEGGTARRFGGTGLGLTISRELARLLGGSLTLASTPGRGSTFTAVVPLERAAPGAAPATVAPPGPPPAPPRAQPPPAAPQSVPDDRGRLAPGDRVVLVIEDDPTFASVLLRRCHEEGFKCLVAGDGKTGLELAALHQPAAVMLDVMLPGMDGWAVLDALKGSPGLRHIPVHVISAVEPTIDARRRGAIAFLTKPVSPERLHEAFERITRLDGRQPRRLLVVEDDPILRTLVVDLLGGGDVTVVEAATGAAALAALREAPADCMVLDLGLPDMTGFELLERLEAEGGPVPPVVVHTAGDLTREEAEQLRRHAETVIIKGVKSEERLLDETSLFLHRVVEALPEQRRKMIASLHDQDAHFSRKKVLLVDDDMRNTFALAKLLRERGLTVHIASDGAQGLALLEQHPDVDLVLMDVMMPEMDGYEATRRIRAQGRFARLPVLALTAKAMKDDRDRCMAAGASDYLSKPVDLDRLLSMLRVWLYR